jgi:cytochrome c553
VLTVAPSLGLVAALVIVPMVGHAAQAETRSGGTAAKLESASADTLEARVAACTGCHGPQGRAAADGYWPRIAGKPAGYLFNQLQHFREGRRSAAAMTWMVDGLPDAYLREIAAHFAAQHPPHAPPMPVVASQAVLMRGRTLALQGDAARKIPACAQCHGEALLGVEPATPGLLGLPRDYVNAQFGAWRNGTRRAHSPDCMADIARKLAPDDIAAVSAWLAAQAVPAHGRPAPVGSVRPPMECGSAVHEATSVTKVVTPVTNSAVAAAANLADLQRLTNGVRPDPASTDPVARGAYLALAGNCAGCHTARGGESYAGGRSIATPFGEVHASNLTPHRVAGIGAWTADDFWRALHEGRSRDGRALNPAFPYTEFTRMSRADSDALFAWLRTLPAVDRPNRPHALRFPFNLQWGIEVWRVIYFKPAVFQPEPGRDALWNRGAYLVQALGHCGACHTGRNALGAPTGTPLAGAALSPQGWHAPSLLDPQAGALLGGSGPLAQQWLATGVTVQAVATGPMARVITDSLQYLTPGDRAAMATYLASIARARPASAHSSARLAAAEAPASLLESGQTLYGTHCAQCHGDRGEGAPPRLPALAGNRAVVQEPATNAIRAVLHGGFAPATAGQPRPWGMPPFGPQLSDREVAAVLTWMRASWGHRASAVEPREVNRLRPVPLD